MGLSDKQFYTMLGLIIVILIWSNVVFWILKNYGDTAGILAINFVNILYIIVILIFLKRKQEVIENGKVEE